MNENMLESQIEEVKDVTGSGTALVSLYISAGTNIASERSRMSQEKSEAQNIKSDQNRKNVEKAIERVNDILKSYQNTPDNGLVLFVGVTEDGIVDYVFDNLEDPLEYSDYTCDSKFHTEPLENHISPNQSVGLLVVERGGSAIGELRGSNIVVHYDENSNVMGKHNAGGQCLHKDTPVHTRGDEIKRIKDISVGQEILAYDESKDNVVYTEVKNIWTSNKKVWSLVTENEKLNISSDHTVFVDSYNGLKEKKVSDLSDGDQLVRKSDDGILTENIIDIKSLNRYSDLIDIETEIGNFFADNMLVHNSAERFDRLIEEQKDNYFKSVYEKLEELFVNENNQPTVDGFVIGGTQITVDNFVSDGYLPKPLKDVRIGGSYAIDIANEESLNELVEKSIDEIEAISEQKEREKMKLFFRSLSGSNEDIHATYGENNIEKALDFGAIESLLVSENVDREKAIQYKEKVENQGGEIVVISDDFSEGEQFWKGFNGLGAILRYQIE